MYETALRDLRDLFQISKDRPELGNIEKETEEFLCEADKLKETLDREEVLVHFEEAKAEVERPWYCSKLPMTITARGKPRPQLQSLGFSDNKPTWSPGCYLHDPRASAVLVSRATCYAKLLEEPLAGSASADTNLLASVLFRTRGTFHYKTNGEVLREPPSQQ